ncbi:MAG: DUF4390 domain-containing protein [Gammaproteobacteria bacterium]|nr:DUF4390 domain-containing protein [Gammaproteobacteria bacterium]
MALLVALCLGSAGARAGEFVVRSAATGLVNQVHVLDADIDYQFSERALTALANGVPLTLRMHITIERERDWLPDPQVAELKQRYEIQYHALSGLHVLTNLNSGASEVYLTLHSALRALGDVRDLPVIDDNLLAPDARYRIAMRVDLDIEALPSPLRPFAYITPAWWLSSDWYTWSLRP